MRICCGRFGDERVAAPRVDEIPEQVFEVYCGIREIDAGDESREEAARENRDDDVGGLEFSVGAGNAPGFDGAEVERAVIAGCDATVAEEVRLSRLVLGVFGMRVF